MSDFVGMIDSAEGHQVYVDGEELPPRFDLANHSPTGFCWGYNGSGPAQLALAILANVSDDATALACYQQFKFQVISKMNRCKGFVLHKACVLHWLDQHLELNEKAHRDIHQIRERLHDEVDLH